MERAEATSRKMKSRGRNRGPQGDPSGAADATGGLPVPACAPRLS